MIRRELAKDPKLATESWDRFLPQFRKRHLRTSEKTAKKNEKIDAKTEARKAAGLDSEKTTERPEPKKKVYTPFPPAQLPRKVDLQLESGEYFLKAHEKEARETEKRKQKQKETTELRRKERAEAFVAPEEEVVPSVEEKRKRKREKAKEVSEGEEGDKKKKKSKKEKKSKKLIAAEESS